MTGRWGRHGLDHLTDEVARVATQYACGSPASVYRPGASNAPKEAKAFDNQLEVPGPHFQIGKKVAVGFAGAEAPDMTSVELCLRVEQQN